MGVVYLVGAGPGDPGLLTLRAAGLLRRADVIIYDALANSQLLALGRPDAKRIDVGKRGGGRRTPQHEIQRLLVEAARCASIVVRLKGGDPFVFGRGGEEALALAAAGVRFEVVPGVTAGLGAAAYAGIPVTHRDHASTVIFVTGHEPATRPEARVDWAGLARIDATLIIYMGMTRLRRIAQRLIDAGRPRDTAVAVVEWGTYPFQRTVSASLDEIADAVEREGLGAPAIIVVGTVAGLREQLEWFGQRHVARACGSTAGSPPAQRFMPCPEAWDPCTGPEAVPVHAMVARSLPDSSAAGFDTGALPGDPRSQQPREAERAGAAARRPRIASQR